MTAKTYRPTVIVLIFAIALSVLLSHTQPAAARVWLATTDQPKPMVIQSQGPIDPAELESFLDDYLVGQMEEHHIPGVVFTMVKDGEVFFSKGYGYADLETQTPFDPEQTVLITASLAKVFAAVGVLQLNERGLIDMHVPLSYSGRWEP